MNIGQKGYTYTTLHCTVFKTILGQFKHSEIGRGSNILFSTFVKQEYNNFVKQKYVS